MKKLIVILFLLSSVAFAKNPQWKKFDEGMKQAKQSGKKVLIDVYTEWCGWCKKMDAATYTDKDVLDYLNKNFVVIKLNAEANETITYAGKKMSPAEFSQGMGVNGYPATLFLKSNGDAITLLPGYSEADMFIHVIRFIGDNIYEKKKFADYLAEKGVKQ
jgi:thioredoxin-related protein